MVARQRSERIFALVAKRLSQADLAELQPILRNAYAKFAGRLSTRSA